MCLPIERKAVLVKEDSHGGQADATQQQATGAEDQAAQWEVTGGGTEGATAGDDCPQRLVWANDSSV